MKIFFRYFSTIIFFILFANHSFGEQITNEEARGDIAGINSLMSAVLENDIEGVNFFIKTNQSLINQKNIGGATSLHLACREGNLEIAKILIENNAEINVFDNEGWTPLMRASLKGNFAIVDLLISRGGNPSYVNSIGETAIIHATNSHCKDCLDLMFKKSNIMKSMDNKILKDQLSESFTIAKNRDDKELSKTIESYLSLTLANQTTNQDSHTTKTDFTTTNQKGEMIKFKLVSEKSDKKAETESNRQQEKEVIKLVKPEKKEVITLVKPEKKENISTKQTQKQNQTIQDNSHDDLINTKNYQDQLQQNQTTQNSSQNQQKNTIFKLNKGPEGQQIIEQKKQQKIIKKNDKKITDKENNSSEIKKSFIVNETPNSTNLEKAN